MPGGAFGLGVFSTEKNDIFLNDQRCGGGFFEKKNVLSVLWYLTVFSIREKEKKSPQHQEVFFKNMSIEKHEKNCKQTLLALDFQWVFLSTLHEIYLFLYSSTKTRVLFCPKGQIRQVGIDVQTDKEHIKGQPRAGLKNRPRKRCGLLVGPFLLGGLIGATSTVYVGHEGCSFCRPKMIFNAALDLSKFPACVS